MMKSGVIFSYKLNWMSIMLCFIGSCCTFDVHGQIMSMPSFLGSSAQSAKSDHPTVITAMTMDFDLENNLADFMGNVVIDDSEMVIECDRMKIFLDDKD